MYQTILENVSWRHDPSGTGDSWTDVTTVPGAQPAWEYMLISPSHPSIPSMNNDTLTAHAFFNRSNAHISVLPEVTHLMEVRKCQFLLASLFLSRK